jgi:hypothetical protein
VAKQLMEMGKITYWSFVIFIFPSIFRVKKNMFGRIMLKWILRESAMMPLIAFN